MEANAVTPQAVGRNHWHHFRMAEDGETRCHYCAMTINEFAATKNLQEPAHGQEKEAA